MPAVLDLVARLLWSFFQVDAFKPWCAGDGVAVRVPAQDQGADADGPPEASDGDPKIVADLSKSGDGVRRVEEREALGFGGKKNKKR